MKLRRILLGAVGLFIAGVVAEHFYQRHVTAQARAALVAWIEGKSGLFDERFKEQETLCRVFSSTGLVSLLSVEQEWGLVAFHAVNKEGKTASFALYKSDGVWHAQGFPVE
jgi:hypothetical protein